MESKNHKRKILIVDDNPVICKGLTHLINQQADIIVCGEAENASEALEAIEALKPDLALIEISLNGSRGIDLIKNIKARHSNFLILVFSMYDESIYAELALRAGANGYIMKIEAVEKISIAIHRVLRGQIYVSDKIASNMLHKLINSKSTKSASPIELLSKREREVFHLIGKGYGTRQIAEALSMGVKTVETHRTHIKKKLELKHNSELVKYSIKWVQSRMLI